MFPVESMDKALAGSGLWGTGTTVPEAEDTFCEHVLFCHGFKNDTAIFTFCVSRRRRKMYCGHARLCVCVSVCLSVRDRTPTLLHGPGCNLGAW